MMSLVDDTQMRVGAHSKETTLPVPQQEELHHQQQKVMSVSSFSVGQWVRIPVVVAVVGGEVPVHVKKDLVQGREPSCRVGRIESLNEDRRTAVVFFSSHHCSGSRAHRRTYSNEAPQQPPTKEERDYKRQTQQAEGKKEEVSFDDIEPAILVVLDLNGVLVRRKRGGGQRRRREKEKGILASVRPDLQQFLSFALDNFVVAVWSSCIPRNGLTIIEQLLPDPTDRKRLFFTWFRDQCTPSPTPENRYGTKKDLSHIWKTFGEHHGFAPSNTIIIDDSPEKCSHPENAYCPIPYKGLKRTQDNLAAAPPPAVPEEGSSAEAGGVPVGEKIDDEVDGLGAMQQFLHAVLQCGTLSPLKEHQQRVHAAQQHPAAGTPPPSSEEGGVKATSSPTTSTPGDDHQGGQGRYQRDAKRPRDDDDGSGVGVASSD